MDLELWIPCFCGFFRQFFRKVALNMLVLWGLDCLYFFFHLLFYLFFKIPYEFLNESHVFIFLFLLFVWSYTYFSFPSC